MEKTVGKNLITDESIEGYIGKIRKEESRLEQHFQEAFEVNQQLDRKSVSFQGNKNSNFFRWFQYREGFSASLVRYLIQNFCSDSENLLDPFCGVGTTLFVGSCQGINTTGIEILPVANVITKSKYTALTKLSEEKFEKLYEMVKSRSWLHFENPPELNTLKITEGAYSAETELKIRKFLEFTKTQNQEFQEILTFLLLSVLESVSYTRKDGQYLRWDGRSKFRNSKFRKKSISDFDTVIYEKIKQIIEDMNPLQVACYDLKPRGRINLIEGSCLDKLIMQPNNFYDAIITSPPYCNRYDYTRTYALELAILGLTQSEVVQLRQNMLSCTVENKEKSLLDINPHWEKIIMATEKLPLLAIIWEYLDYMKKHNKLNNNNIPRMVKGYFLEIACILYECYRVLNLGGYLLMINDNVLYANVAIPVDTILSRVAEMIGFRVEKIMVSPNSKGNSSQQMKNYGRTPLRKCVYVWRKVSE